MRPDDDLLCCYFDRITHSLTHGATHVGLNVATDVPPAPEILTLRGYGVDVRVIDAAGLWLCLRLRQTLPPEIAPSGTSSHVALDYIVTLVAAQESHGPFEYVVTRNSLRVFATAIPDDVYWWIRRDIEHGVAAHCDQMVFVHAGVVSWRGIAILVPGRSAIGKSKVVSALVQRGATYYSDTFAVLDDAGNVHPYRTMLEEDPYQPQNLRVISGGSAPEAIPVGLMVTGAFAPWSAWRPTILRGATAVLPLIDNMVDRRETTAAIESIADRVAMGAVGLRGPRPDALEVAATVLALMDDAVVSLAMAGSKPGPASTADALAEAARVRLQIPTGRPLDAWRQLVAARYVGHPVLFPPAEHRRLLECVSQDAPDGWHARVIGAHGVDARVDASDLSGTLSGTRRDEIGLLIERRLLALLPFVRQQLQVRPFRLARIEWRITTLDGATTFSPRVPTGQQQAWGHRITGLYVLRASPASCIELRLYDSWHSTRGVVDGETYSSLHPAENSVVFWPRRAPHRVVAAPAAPGPVGLAITFAIWKERPSAGDDRAHVTGDAEGPSHDDAVMPAAWPATEQIAVAPVTKGRTTSRMPGRRLVAVVVPAYRRPTLDERISLRHLRTHLGEFDRYVIGAHSAHDEFADFARTPARACAFVDKDSYNQMLLAEPFFRAFERYEYLLIHQLDCLVFSNQLAAWCEKDFDYIGAPWFNRWHRAEVVRPEATDDMVNGFGSVGNGGFSLRKIDTALAVLTQRPRTDPQMRQLLQRSGNEDIFWSYMANQLVDRYRRPSPREALSFAFETELRYAYRENGYRLPFGCHGWSSYERDFWEPFLLT